MGEVAGIDGADWQHDQNIGGIEFARAVKSAMGLGHVLAEQAISADKLAVGETAGCVRFHDQQVIAKIVETIAVSLLRASAGAPLLIEHPVAERLALAHFVSCSRKADGQATSGEFDWR